MEENPVTDVVAEQLAAGDAEPAPTPVSGTEAVPKPEEVDQPGGLEKVDELVEEAKQEEQQAALADEPMLEAAEDVASRELEVKESKPEEEPVIQTAPQPIVEESSKPGEQKQERIANPIYTLEVVGNRYNPTNFW